jgi:hypothetical protein
MMPRPTNVDSSLPSGPRSQPQIVTSRDTGHTDLRNNARLPPSGPSAASTARSRPTFSGNQQPPASRDGNVMDVDAAAPARPPPLRINDMPIRANSGMYADREQRVEINAGTDAAPRGPRAMTNRMQTSSSLPPFVPSPSTSPTTPFYPQRLVGGQERTGGRLTQRSPPPHLGTNNVTQLRDGPPTGLSAGGMSMQDIPPRRASNASERGQPYQGSYQEVDLRDQVGPNCNFTVLVAHHVHSYGENSLALILDMNHFPRRLRLLPVVFLGRIASQSVTGKGRTTDNC